MNAKSYCDCVREADGDRGLAALLWAKVQQESGISDTDGPQGNKEPNTSISLEAQVNGLERAVKASGARITSLVVSLEYISNESHIIRNTLVQMAGMNGIPFPCSICHNIVLLLYDANNQRWRCSVCGAMPSRI